MTTNAQKALPGGSILAPVVCTLAFFGVLIAIAANVDRQAWGAALVVGLLGPVGGIVLAVLGAKALRRAGLTWIRVVAGVGIALAVLGILLALLALRD